MSSTAVVILNWNGMDFMRKFIPLILSRTDFSDGSALYVADNGSQDGSVEWVRETWPGGEVRLVCMDRNYGFTGGYNRAFAEIERSGAQFYGRLARGTGAFYGLASTLRSMCAQDSQL